MKTMDIGGIRIVGLGIYIEKISSLVISDLHLGYEEVLEKQGISLPQSQYPKMRKEIERMVKETNPKKLIVNGDIKHEFSGAQRQEWSEVSDLASYLKDAKTEMIAIRGNHDNYLIPILKKNGVELRDNYSEKGYYFAHGHGEISTDAGTIIIGNDHPSISFRDELGVKLKFKCLLDGEANGKRIIVLPAFSPLMPGSDINQMSKNDFLSPTLKSAPIGGFTVYVIEQGVGVYKFGKLAQIREMGLL